MDQRRFDLVFCDTSVFIAADKPENKHVLFDGAGLEDPETTIRTLLRFYDLGAKHKAAEIRKVLEVN